MMPLLLNDVSFVKKHIISLGRELATLPHTVTRL